MASLHRTITRNMLTHGFRPRRVKRPARWTPRPSSKRRNPIQAAQMAARKPKRVAQPKPTTPVRRVHPVLAAQAEAMRHDLPPAPVLTAQAKPVVTQQQIAEQREQQKTQQRSLLARARQLFRRQKKG